MSTILKWAETKLDNIDKKAAAALKTENQEFQTSHIPNNIDKQSDEQLKQELKIAYKELDKVLQMLHFK